MLEKKAGIQKNHLICIIRLLEADLKTALKIIFARQMMCNAELPGMTNSQWGVCANRSAHQCALRKLITWDWAPNTQSVLVDHVSAA
ncbi:hypothetical protein ACHAWF_007326 [Thalassiosira exigua]